MGYNYLTRTGEEFKRLSCLRKGFRLESLKGWEGWLAPAQLPTLPSEIICPKLKASLLERGQAALPNP